MKKPTSDIKAFGVSFRATALLAAAFALTSATQAALLINENFESTKWSNGTILTSTVLNGWTAPNISSDSSKGIVQISNGDWHGGSQSLYLRDDLTGYTATASYDLGQTVSAGSLDFWVRQDINYGTVNYRVDFSSATGAVNFDFVIYNPGGSTAGSVGNGLYIRRAGGIIAGISFTDANFTAGNWNNINIAFDKSAGTLNVLLNSVTILSLNASQLGETNLEAGRVAFNAGYGGGGGMAAYFDDIVFETPSIPEPSTYAAVGGLFSLGLAFWLRRRST